MSFIFFITLIGLLFKAIGVVGSGIIARIDRSLSMKNVESISGNYSQLNPDEVRLSIGDTSAHSNGEMMPVFDGPFNTMEIAMAN